MFFERNIPVDFISAREFDPASLAKYKLVVAPYPILLMAEVAAALEKYVEGGGHLFVEARPGWVDERGFAQPVVPGFGWEKMFGVRERTVTPKPETKIVWTATSSATPSLKPTPIEFSGARFEERFEILEPTVRPLATFDDGTAAAFQHDYGKGSAVILGTFAGQINETKPQAMHPLGDFLAQWAGLTRVQMEAPAGVEVQRMVSDKGEMLFFFNHTSQPAHVKYTGMRRVPLDITNPSSPQMISSWSAPGVPADRDKFPITSQFDIPPQGVQVFRVNY
jgi:beta-galactosidase